MTIRRYEISDFEWAIIAPITTKQASGRGARRGPQGSKRDLLAPANRLALGRHPGAVWTVYDLL